MRVLGAIVVALMAMMVFFVPAMFLVCICAISAQSEAVGWIGGMLAAGLSLCFGYWLAASLLNDGSEDHAKSSRSVQGMMDVYDVSKKPNAHDDCEGGAQGPTDAPDE